MNITAILFLIGFYFIIGTFIWEFWLLLLFDQPFDKDEKYNKLLKIPLIIFILFWPIVTIIILKIIYFSN